MQTNGDELQAWDLLWECGDIAVSGCAKQWSLWACCCARCFRCVGEETDFSFLKGREEVDYTHGLVKLLALMCK